MNKPKRSLLSPALPTLLPALLAAFIGLTDGTARAAEPGVPVPPLHLTNLGPAAGKFINVFYVLASEAVIGVKGQQLEFSEIRLAPFREQIPANGVVDVPAVSVPKRSINGLTISYSYIYIAINDAQPNALYLRNENGGKKPIIDPRMSEDQIAKLHDASFKITDGAHTGFISKLGLASHTRNGVVDLDVVTDLRH